MKLRKLTVDNNRLNDSEKMFPGRGADILKFLIHKDLNHLKYFLSFFDIAFHKYLAHIIETSNIDHSASQVQPMELNFDSTSYFASHFGISNLTYSFRHPRATDKLKFI